MDNRQYFIDIINRFIDGGVYCPPDDIDWFEIKHLAEIHSMLGIVGIVIARSNIKNIPLECYELFDFMIFDGARKGILIENTYKQVVDALDTAGVNHIVVKGYVLRNLYPEKDMRTMGDIDFFAKKSDMEKISEALKGAGFKLEHIYKGEWSYIKNDMTVEFTCNLMESDVGFFDYAKYVANFFDYAVLTEKHAYQLTLEAHFIYMMLHIMKHFYVEGCGVRMILDIALYIEKYKNSLDWKFINKEFKKLKIELFAKNIMAVCYRLFNKGRELFIDDELYNEIYDYILEGGAFGFARKNYEIANSRDRIAKNESYAGTLFKRAFPSDETMRGLICWYRNKSKIFLPAAWVYRWFHSVAIKKGSLVKSVILSGEQAESRKQLELLKKIGLYRK